MKQMINFAHKVAEQAQQNSNTIADGIELNEFQKDILNRIFNSLAAAKPQAKAQYRESPNDAKEWKRMLALAIREARLTQDQIEAGLRAAISSSSPYFPAVGEFISLCRGGEKTKETGMQDAFQARLREEEAKFQAEQKMISSTSWKDRKEIAAREIGGLRAALGGVK